MLSGLSNLEYPRRLGFMGFRPIFFFGIPVC
jgi:hypothetical protein